MKGLLLGLVLLVLFVHFGGPNVPKVLKDNKQMVYGVTIGLVLCSFFGVKVEGLESSSSRTCNLEDGTVVNITPGADNALTEDGNKMTIKTIEDSSHDGMTLCELINYMQDSTDVEYCTAFKDRYPEYYNENICEKNYTTNARI